MPNIVAFPTMCLQIPLGLFLTVDFLFFGYSASSFYSLSPLCYIVFKFLWKKSLSFQRKSIPVIKYHMVNNSMKKSDRKKLSKSFNECYSVNLVRYPSINLRHFYNIFRQNISILIENRDWNLVPTGFSAVKILIIEFNGWKEERKYWLENHEIWS